MIRRYDGIEQKTFNVDLSQILYSVRRHMKHSKRKSKIDNINNAVKRFLYYDEHQETQTL